MREKGAIALAVLDLIPPPFPFTPFVLAAGALDVTPRTFFVTLTVCRVLRFGLEAALALVYGKRIMAWLDSDLFHDIVTFFIALAIALTVLSLVQVVRATRPARRRRLAASEHPAAERHVALRHQQHDAALFVRHAQRQHLRHVRADLLRRKVHDRDDQPVQQRLLRVVLRWPALTTS